MSSNETNVLTVKERILQANQEAAAGLRDYFGLRGTLVTNLISSPGSGKTSLLEATVQRLRDFSVAVLEGDIATERDADRIRALGVDAHQILTGGACHLDARLVQQELGKAGWLGNGRRMDFLFIENVGNLICPTSYDLGEDFKVAVLSVTEGDDKPFKYPAIFSRAVATVITKVDLLPYLQFRVEEVENRILSLNPRARIFHTSAKTGMGMHQWCRFLREAQERKGTMLTASV
ncbi:MAG TPA: hydrogenase nickel incorporation protein HypB [Acidobacteriota bacterium]|nr:hydrogenase nickel incorporation protein HypB [Acidobacteriota bacterium]